MSDRHLFEHLAAYVLSMHADKVKTATKYLLPNLTVRISQDRYATRKQSRVRVTVSVGRPNYAERQFIKKAHPDWKGKFPVQFTRFPKKKQITERLPNRLR